MEDAVAFLWLFSFQSYGGEGIKFQQTFKENILSDLRGKKSNQRASPVLTREEGVKMKANVLGVFKNILNVIGADRLKRPSRRPGTGPGWQSPCPLCSGEGEMAWARLGNEE